MRFLPRTAALVAQTNWRSTESVSRLGVLLAIISIVVAVFLLLSRVGLDR